MPVLDARALERDPEGAAFLLSVLRPVPCCVRFPDPGKRLAVASIPPAPREVAPVRILIPSLLIP
jgi:hypothetical protein